MEANDQSRFILIEGHLSKEIFPIDRPDIIIGRDPAADILINSPGISRRHARLFQQEGATWLEDLGSRNGTFVNGERITHPHRLQPDDEVRLGQSVALLFQQPQVAATTVEPLITAQQATMLDGIPAVAATMMGEESLFIAPRTPPCLTITVAGEKPCTYTLTKPEIRIGRAPDNDIVIDVQIVSRYQARLEKDPGGYRLNVLPDAANPILLDGRPIPADRKLVNGEILRIGSLDPGMMVTLAYSEEVPVQAGELQPIRFGEKTLIQIGRDPGNDVVLASLQSRASMRRSNGSGSATA